MTVSEYGNKTPVNSNTYVLPDNSIRRMIAERQIIAEESIDDSQIQPASLDLRLGMYAYHVRASFLAGGVKKRVDDCISHGNLEVCRIDLTKGALLKVGCVYIIPLVESLNLPSHIYALANSKSSSGRLDIFTRLITDFGEEFDRVPLGYQGNLYLEVCSGTFDIIVHSHLSLNQIRFKDVSMQITESLHDSTHIINHLMEEEVFSVNLRRNDETDIIGYKAKKEAGIIDLRKVNYYDSTVFWDCIYASDKDMLVLEPNEFYILSSSSIIQVPPLYAAEMIPYISFLGEFRVHYAGFFDPNFGYKGKNNESLGNTRAVLEVRCREVPFVLFHGQSMGKIVYEKLKGVPDRLYGEDGIGSHYQGQSLCLSKHFLSK